MKVGILNSDRIVQTSSSYTIQPCSFSEQHLSSCQLSRWSALSTQDIYWMPPLVMRAEAALKVETAKVSAKCSDEEWICSHRAQVPRSQSESSERWQWCKQLLFVIVQSSGLSSAAVGLPGFWHYFIRLISLDIYLHTHNKCSVRVIQLKSVLETSVLLY